jgi:hypothetical protein
MLIIRSTSDGRFNLIDQFDILGEVACTEYSLLWSNGEPVEVTLREILDAGCVGLLLLVNRRPHRTRNMQLRYTDTGQTESACLCVSVRTHNLHVSCILTR